ncbi:MAG: hypothetical protein KatS3mg060_0565 [Dehalococcoidia bacterium]|nr:MAG: hypothetical protein KatS3mg060_0565 [Dehalococcoidia bacterium]
MLTNLTNKPDTACISCICNNRAARGAVETQMAVLVRVPGPLESVTGGKRVIEADGATVSEVLERLGEDYPGLRERVVAENGEIHRFVNVYLNDEDIRFIGGIETPVKDGDTLAILPALAGGATHAIR